MMVLPFSLAVLECVEDASEGLVNVGQQVLLAVR
jgi:hypothetical protein